MFQLIVTVISIALIAALAIASIFYGGSAYSDASAKAARAKILNGAQQVAAATQMHFMERGTIPVSTQTLVAQGYLQSAPPGVIDTTTNPLYDHILTEPLYNGPSGWLTTGIQRASDGNNVVPFSDRAIVMLVDLKACQAFNRSNADPVRILSVTTLPKYGCYTLDDSESGMDYTFFDATPAYAVLYRWR